MWGGEIGGEMKKFKATRKQAVDGKTIDIPYTGIFYRIGKRIGGKGEEKIYYVTYKKDGKKFEEAIGRQYKDKMTPSKAVRVRADIIEGRRLPKTEQRAVDQAKERDKYTINRLWQEYSLNRTSGKSLYVDQGRYKKYIEPVFGSKEPKELIKLDVDRVRIKLLKRLSPQTVKHVLNLLTWIINYGVKNNLCNGVSFHIQKPSVNNEVTEDLNPEQLNSLLKAIEEDENIDVGNMMKMALYTGMRRGELFKLKWQDINFETGFIFLRNPKGGSDQKLPINNMARELLRSIVTGKRTGYVFPGLHGGMRTTTGEAGRRIRKRAGLPDGFRPMHGLRHVYASMLASSGKVDMYVLQTLMTHKSPKMTQRYAHLRDDALKGGASQIDDIFKQLTPEQQKVINIGK